MEYILEQSKFHRYLDTDNFDNFETEIIADEDLEVSAKLSYQQKKELPDSDFAVVLRVKDKRTGETRKIRKYVISDEAHVRNALARLGQEAPKKGLEKLGISVEKTKEKVLKKAKQLGMTDLLERHKEMSSEMEDVDYEQEFLNACDDIRELMSKLMDSYKEKETLDESKKCKTNQLHKAVKTLAKKIKDLQTKHNEEISKCKSDSEEMKKKIDLYSSNAQLIISRRQELGQFAQELSDEDLLNKDKYDLAIMQKSQLEQKKTTLETASLNVGSAVKIDDIYAKMRKRINQQARDE